MQLLKVINHIFYLWSKGMIEFVKKGVRTSVALSREESDRQAEAA